MNNTNRPAAATKKTPDSRTTETGRRIAQAVKKSKGAAWDIFTDDIRREFIAARVFSEAVGSGAASVDVAMIDSFYAAACEAAGV